MNTVPVPFFSSVTVLFHVLIKESRGYWLNFTKLIIL